MGYDKEGVWVFPDVRGGVMPSHAVVKLTRITNEPPKAQGFQNVKNKIKVKRRHAMRILKGVLAVLSFLMFTAAIIDINNASAGDTEKTLNGIKATLKVDPSKNMMDLYLADSETRKPITDAKVSAAITLPGGHKVEKELMGMKMGEAFSFMNTLDMSQKGRYIFDIKIESGKKVAEFRFTYEV